MKLRHLLLLTSLVLTPCTWANPPADPLYVTPNAKGNGERATPTSLSQAVRQLDSTGGTILLLSGTYHQPVKIDGSGTAPITIKVAEGEKVVFEGGAPVIKWTPREDGLFEIEAPGRTAKFNDDLYWEVWNNHARIRFRKVFDADGARAWPNSVAPIDNDRLLVHIGNGETPATANLWHSRQSDGLTISRSKVTIEGIHFQNYVGGRQARALSITPSTHVAIKNCTFKNCAIGISSSGNQTLVEGCRFEEMGLGIRHANGKEMTIRNCVIQSAAGLFAFSDLGEHLRNGIRIYHPADGATVEGNITAGFWAGLYIKTISGRDGSLPYHVTGNTFLDGIRSGADHHQPRSFYKSNIVGPQTGDGVGPNGSYLAKMGATLHSNYFYGSDGAPLPGNEVGPEPFTDFAKGDLRPKIPANGKTPLGAPHAIIQWEPRLLAAELAAKPSLKPLAPVGDPVVTTSTHGAIVKASYTRPVKGYLSYRIVGTKPWTKVKGRNNTITPPETVQAAAPVEFKTPDQYSLLFPLIDGLESEAEYEFRINVTDSEGNQHASSVARFITTGSAKEIHVNSGAQSTEADGSLERPFATLQDAVDRALPGDTIRLAKGVYTGATIINHGGTAKAPLSIIGEGYQRTILDGGKEVSAVLKIEDAHYLVIKGMQFRWFGNNGVMVQRSSHGSFLENWVLNGFTASGGGVSAQGLQLKDSPHWYIERSLFTRVQNGIYAISSPGLKIRNNTTYGNLYSGITLVFSSKETEILHNTLNFTGNQALRIREDSPDNLATLICDYNNYGGILRDAEKINANTGSNIPTIRPENDFTPSERYGRVSEYKYIISTTLSDKKTDYFRMQDWQQASGKDTHSIFADPEFASPLKNDFSLLAHSPNRLKDGSYIGAVAPF